MTTEEVIRYIMSFLGGGFAVAVGNWLNSSRAARKQREIDSLKLQLQSLYGPLFFFTQQNDKLFVLCGQFDGAYTSEFVSKSWSQDEHTQTTVQQEADNTIEIKNLYVHRIVANNERVMEILENGWHLVDADDINELAQFQVDFTRFKTEVEGAVKTPYRIYKAVGEVSYMRPAMIARITEKVSAKEARLQDLMRSW